MEARRYLFTRCLSVSGIIASGTISILGKAFLSVSGSYYPVFQTALMFLGESLCYLLVPLFGRLKKVEDDDISPEYKVHNRSWLSKMRKYGYCIVAIFEFFNAALETIAFNFLQPAVIVSLKMLRTLYILYYRIFRVNRTVFKHQKIGIAMYLLGMTVIIIEIAINRTHYEFKLGNFLSVIILLLAELFAALVLLSQEHLMKILNTSPAEVSGIKGLTGCILCIILYLPIEILMQQIFPSVSSKKLIDKLQNTTFMLASWGLIINFALYNYLTVRTLKFTESLTICTIESGRVIIIWVIEICTNLSNVFYIEILGAVLVVFGLLIYNEVIIIPCFGLKESAQESMEENKLYVSQKIKLNPIFFLPVENLHKDLEVKN